ncbi:MAG: glycoside hydrolase family 3 N-terminal domain-containing protein [Bacteroidales bacterium]|nr:glycoside hydrolase family 3 N-terminal domain-containing protein [Bacteroidales bacterium]
MRKTFAFLFTLFLIFTAQAQNLLNKVDSVAMYHWVDSVMQTLSPDQRLGQLIMPQVVGGNTPQVRAQILELERRFHIGGIFFSKGTIESQKSLTQYAQHLAEDSSRFCAGLPLLIGIDGEWGLAMRLSDAPKFPRNKSLGQINATVRDSMMYLYGQEVARECKLLGIHVNFAPVLDINSNPNNPVIGTRSFGETTEQVIDPALAYAKGLESGGVLSCGKHFPGHGDTDTDSHKALPRLAHSKDLMYERELKPFFAYANAGLGALMVAHLDVPSLSGKEGIPSTASKEIVNNILREEIRFNGLIFTDGLAMKGASNYPDICTKALLAGNDILLQPHPIAQQWRSLLSARKNGQLPQELIDEKCRRVLMWKYALIIANPVKTTQGKVNSTEARQLVNLLTKLSQDKKQLPESNNSNSTKKTETDPTLQADSAQIQNRHHPKVGHKNKHSELISALAAIAREGFSSGAYPGCQILVAQHGEILYQSNFGYLDPQTLEPVKNRTLYDLASVTKAAATVPAVMLTIDKYGVKLTDKLSKYIKELQNTDKQNLTVEQALMHETGLRSAYNFYALTIDSASIDNRLYSGKRQGKYTIQQDKSTWFHEGLKFKPFWITQEKDSAHTLQVADKMFVRQEIRDSILTKIISLPLHNIGKYRYSDLNFVLLRIMVERVSQQSIDQLLTLQLPELFGGEQLCYLPLNKGIEVQNIAPTEIDNALRHQQLRGFVHDETAAWSGGVEGNAGLFGSAQGLFPVLQMFVDKGRIANRQAISKETCELFTTKKSKISRRGLGFDKPETNPQKSNPCSDNAPASVFGHTGFTGSCFWIDPDKEIVFIFLCNRVNPHRWNSKLTQANIRTRLQGTIYDNLK